MKKLQKILEPWFEKFKAWWSALSVGTQQKYTLVFFFVYALLTAGVILKVWYDAGKPMIIEHIENPVLPKKKVPEPSLQDSISILKKEMYESERE